MADVLVEGDAEIFGYVGDQRDWVVWTDAVTGYVFYSENTLDDFEYRKTTDGGETWSGPTIVVAGQTRQFDLWFDKWTPGDSGTLIHLWTVEHGADDTVYRTLDTSDDSLGIQRVVFSNTDSVQTNRNNYNLSGTKAVSGRLYCFTYPNVPTHPTEHEFLSSDDAGATWDTRTDVLDGDAIDIVFLFPDDDSADTDDIVALYWDRSDSEISIKKFDASAAAGAGSWAETLISAGMSGDDVLYKMWSAVLRLSDGHIILAAWSEKDTATADLRVWDIDVSTPNAASKTAVITNQAEVACVGLLIDQNDDTLYCAYLGTEGADEVWETNVGVYYKVSSDGGDTWGDETRYDEQDTKDDLRAVGAGSSTPGANPGRFMPVFFNDDLDDFYVNFNNSISLPLSVEDGAADDLPQPAAHGANVQVGRGKVVLA